MFGSFAKKIFGSANDRRLKGYGRKSRRSTRWSPRSKELTDDELRARTRGLPGRARRRQDASTICSCRLSPRCARRRKRVARAAAFRRPADRRHGAARRRDRRNADRRRQDARRDARLSISTRSPARACMSSPSTTISPAATPNGWAASTTSSASTVGVIVHGLEDDERRRAYAGDITYGTNNEFGFDYLRDNMKYELAQMVQRGHHYAIVDEVDSILVDEARTPLIISGPSDDRSDLYIAVDKLIPQPRRKRTTNSTRSSAPSNLTEPAMSIWRSCWRERGPAQAKARSMMRSNVTARASREPGLARAQIVHSATRITSCATARSSSSTSSPAA